MKTSSPSSELVRDLERGIDSECDEWDKELESARLILRLRNAQKCTWRLCVGMTLILIVIGSVMGWVFGKQ